jgi:hypothetical protein
VLTDRQDRGCARLWNIQGVLFLKKRGGYLADREIFRFYRTAFTELYNWTQTEVTSSLHPYTSNLANVFINIRLPFILRHLPLRFSDYSHFQISDLSDAYYISWSSQTYWFCLPNISKECNLLTSHYVSFSNLLIFHILLSNFPQMSSSQIPRRDKRTLI